MIKYTCLYICLMRGTLKMKLEAKKFNFIKLSIFGFIIGIAAITPGLSGGIMAISFGIYAKLISSITNLHKNFKESLCFLLPFGLGGVLGVFIFGLTMQSLLENYERSIIWVFMGLIVGSIPSLIKEAKQGSKFKFSYLIPMFVTFALGYFLNNITEKASSAQNISEFMLFIAGGILVLGSIIPGISSSFMLMHMGIYDNIIDVLTSFDIYSVFWLGIGAVIFFVCSIKLVNFLFDRFHSYAYFAAFGFLLSTIVAVFPEACSVMEAILFTIALLAVYFFMSKYSSKEE